jgi:spore coat polysaccharide biosynthesis protein SpsF
MEHVVMGMMPRKVISIQARMNSSRLPGKPLAEVMGVPLLAYQIERLRRVKDLDELVVATTRNQADDPIVRLASDLGCVVVRGSETDTPARHLQVVRETNANVLGFLGADQPLVDPASFDRAFAASGPYVKAIGTPHGLHVWTIIRTALWSCVLDRHRNADEREHMGAYWDARPGIYPPTIIDQGFTRDYRITVDTAEDLEVHRRILTALYPSNPRFTLADIVELMDSSGWAAINAHVAQYYWVGAR